MTIIWFTYELNPELIEEVQEHGHTCLQATSEIVVRQLAALTIQAKTPAKEIITEIGLIMGRQRKPNSATEVEPTTTRCHFRGLRMQLQRSTVVIPSGERFSEDLAMLSIWHSLVFR